MVVIRWLHISDFHTGKDIYGQQNAFHYVLDNVSEMKTKNQIPDFVFITGDIANFGKPSEYEEFVRSFYRPLRIALPQTKIFCIPGNHDVDIKEAENVIRHGVLSKYPDHFDANPDGLKRRRVLFPRFQAFFDAPIHDDASTNWLFSEKGYFAVTLPLQNMRIGVAGLNTAWLVEKGGEDDKEKITPGKVALESALRELEAQDCDVKIVLGHHPIYWFENPKPIRSLLHKFQAIYLHGHLHKNEAVVESIPEKQFPEIQTGSVFQSREDEIWRNAILWCAYYPEGAKLEVQPLKWDEQNQYWDADTFGFFDKKYRVGEKYVFPTPFPPIFIQNQELPTGWQKINHEFLATHKRELDVSELAKFFNGAIPQWRHSLSDAIYPRQLVKNVIDDLNSFRSTGLRVINLIGPGGEGKSTILRQIVTQIVQDYSQDWQVIWHQDVITSLPDNIQEHLPITKGKMWLIVSDDAELIGHDLTSSLRKMSLNERTDIQILLCCRDTDWRKNGLEYINWSGLGIDYKSIKVAGLSEVDASHVFDKWKVYGLEGERLSHLDRSTAVRHLMSSAYLNELRGGTFLGALLEVRFGQQLTHHVQRLLDTLYALDAAKTDTGTSIYLDAFIFISILHALNFQQLSEDILTTALQLSSPSKLNQILYILGQEAALSFEAKSVLTRHRRIAEEAVKLFQAHPRYLGYSNLDDYYIRVVQASLKVRKSGKYVPDLGNWRYFPSNILAKAGYLSSAIKVALNLAEFEPEDPFYPVEVAKLYRDNQKNYASINVFRNPHPKLRPDRAYYHEWGTSEGFAGNLYLSAFLYGKALDDKFHEQSLENDRAKISLNGIAIVFSKLLKTNNQLHNLQNSDIQNFINTGASAAQLGLLVPIEHSTQTTHHNLEEIWTNYYQTQRGIQVVSVSTSLAALKQGLELISVRLEYTALQDPRLKHENWSFNQLAARCTKG